jgi:hypothetical protein
MVLACLGVFAMANAQNYRMIVTMKDGSTTSFKADDVKDVTFENNGVTDTVTVEYVEVAGIKWAKGNLRYVNGVWSLADSQWATTQYVGGSDDQTLDADYKNSEYFSWGIVGKDAVDGTWCDAPGVDLTKFYSDDDATVVTEDYDEAVCGDLAKWATRGSYRMPTRDEFNQLIEQASQQYGYVTTSDGNQVYGLLFTNPEGEVTQDLEPREILQSELADGLFLPCIGLGWYDQITHAGKQGSYWSSTPVSSDVNGRDAYFLTISADGAECYSTLRSLRCGIRPVVNDETETPEEEYADMSVADLNALTADKEKVNLTLNDEPGFITYINDNDVYMRCGEQAIRLSSMGLETVVSVGDVCMGSIKGDFILDEGMPVLVSNDDTEASLANFMHLAGGSGIEPTEATIGEVVANQHRCDLIKLSNVKLIKNEYGIIYTKDGDMEVMIADGFGVSPFPETIDSTANYVIEGIFAAGNPLMIYPTKAIASVATEVENLAAFKQIPDGSSTLLKLTDAQVTYVFRPYGETYIYMKDASGAACFHNFSLGFDAEGKTINGSLTAKYSAGYVEATEATNADNLTITDGEAPQPIEKDVNELSASDIDGYFTVKNVKIEDAGNGQYRLATSEGSTDVYVSNGFYLDGNEFSSVDSEATYDVTGILSSDQGLTIKLTKWFTKSE